MSEIGRAMLDILPDESAWHKGSYLSADGTRRCLMGALDEVTTRDRTLVAEYYDGRRKLAELITREYPDRREYGSFFSAGDDFSVVVCFNDNPLTEYLDVRAILEKLAAQE